MPNTFYTYILNIYDLVWLGLWHINHCRLFNAKYFLYIYIKYMLSNHFVNNIFKQTRTHFSHSLMVLSISILYE